MSSEIGLISSERIMKLMFVGAGAVGGYFGGRLVQSGHDVSFPVRANRAGQIERDGLRISSPLGDYRTAPRYHLLDGIDPDTDVAVLSCKAYDLSRMVDELAAWLPARSLILPLLNGLEHYSLLDAAFGADRILGRLCHIGATLTDDGEIVHSNTMQFFACGPRSDTCGDSKASMQAASSLPTPLQRCGTGSIPVRSRSAVPIRRPSGRQVSARTSCM
jgi:2-dehydropantoate 2-reductase